MRGLLSLLYVVIIPDEALTRKKGLLCALWRKTSCAVTPSRPLAFFPPGLSCGIMRVLRLTFWVCSITEAKIGAMTTRKHEVSDLQGLGDHLQDIQRIQAPTTRRPTQTPEPKLAPIYQLKITLRDIKPPIWRRVQAPGNITLAKLHTLIQVAMGWTDSHLHSFQVGDVIYAVPDPNYDFEVKNSRRARLAEVAPTEKSKILYEYDFGDSWEHDILVEKVLPPDPNARLPVCLAGRRACPPEDVGGVEGYANFLEIMRDPENPEHEEMLSWYGAEFDSEAFDGDEITRALQKMKW